MKILILIFSSIFWTQYGYCQVKKVIIDADTANELDDIVAISRALHTEELEVIGLTAAQWNHQLSYQYNTTDSSWIINNEILHLLDKEHIPSYKGSEMIIGKPWGGTEPRASEAAQFIIDKALEANENEKLIVICLGSFTNLASAILLEPKISTRVSAYLVGAIYDPDQQVWNKNEFNVRNDLSAFDVLLDTEGLEIHLMPANVSRNLIFSKETAAPILKSKGAIGDYILQRWGQVGDGKNEHWIMWDLTIISALINPELAQKSEATTPPENNQRKIFVYTVINPAEIEADFWNSIP